MNNFELLTLLLSTTATIISIVTLVRTRKIQEEQMRLEKVSAEFSKRQVERMDQEDSNNRKASIHVTLEKNGTGYKFWIRNHGRSKAADVWFTLDSSGSDNPIIGSEYKEKIPIPFLNSGGEVSLTAAIYLESSGKYKLSARWINEDKTQSSEEFFVSV